MSEMFLSTSPQRPEDVVGSFVPSSVADVRRVAASARDAQTMWAPLAPTAKARALNMIADSLETDAKEMADLAVREVGKPIVEMRAEIDRAIATLRYYAQTALDPLGDTLPAQGTSLLFTVTRPHGVVGLVTPWNFPVAIPVWKMAPALAFGNAVLLKPAPEATTVAVRLVDLMNKFLPVGLVTIVPGGGETGSAVIDAVDAISFTGSTSAGRIVAQQAAKRGLPVQAELGGLNATIIFPDADVRGTALLVAQAAMGYAGQKCTATSRLIVVGDPSEFTEAFVAAVHELAVGDPSDEATVVGPVISDKAREVVLSAAGRAKDAGNRCLVGGTAIDREGWFVAPTLFDQMSSTDYLAQHEVFGPICSILTAKSDDEAIQMANGVPYGLSGAVFTADLDRALKVISCLEVGLAKINSTTTGAEFHAPFGGIKSSSIGPREQGKAAREFYTWTQTVNLSPSPGP